MFALVALFGTNFVASNPSQADDPDWVVDQESGWSVEASEGRILRITEPGTYTISRPASKNANCGIDVRAPGEVTLRLDGINCGGDWNTICGINLDRDGRRWNTNIILTEGSKNYFLSAVEANGGPANTCGINHPAGGGGVLTIDAEGDGSGYLYARGGEYYLGIGSKGGWWGEKAGKIVINGGHIRAEGSLKSASIGGGRWQSSEGVTINGGVIEAASGHHAAGVIGAYEAERTSGTILINGGIIIAGSIGGFATSNSTVIVNAGTLYRRNYDQDGGQLFHLNTKTVIRDGSACSAPLSHVRLSEEEDAPNIHVARIPITNPDVRSIIIDPHENRPRTVTRPGDTINAEGTWSNTTFCPWLAGTYHEILADGVTYIAKRTEDQQAFTVKQPNIAPAIASAQANTSSIQATLENDESATRGAVQYRWRKAGEENWANWTGSITRLTADTLYEVQARYLENDTYWSSDPSETFRVRTEPNVSLPTGLSGTSGTSLSQISLSNYARWSWQNPQTMLTATDAQQFPAKFQVANAPEQATSWNGFPTGCTYSESDVAIVCPLTVRVNATRNSWQSGHELAVRDGAYGSGSFAASGTLTYGQVSFIYSGIWGTQYAASETAPTEAGTYSVTASANAGVNSQGIVYQAFSDARNFRITQTDWSLRAPVAKIGLNYNAAAQKLLEDPGQASDSSGSTGTLRYLVQQGEPVQNFSEQDPRWTTDPNSVVGTDGGEYTVWWYAPADRNHTQSAYQHVRAHIAKNSWTLSQFPALADNLTYMDSKAMLTVPAHVADQTTGQNGLVEYAITNGDDRPDTPSTRWSEDIPVNSDLHAGTHSVWMRVHEDAGHNAFGPISIGSMNIARSHWEVEAPEGVEDLTYYADMPQELVVPGEVTGVGEVSGAVIEYAIGSAQTAPAEDSSAWSDEIPSAIEPGLYHVWWRVLADMNHDTLMSETPIAVEISGAPWDVEQEPLPVSNLSFTGEPLELVQPGRLWDETGAEHGFEYAVFTDPTATPTETDWSETTPVASDANTYIVWYRSKPDGVHTPIEPAQYTVEIARAPIPVPPAVNGLVYDGSEKTGVPAATEYTVEANTATEAKTYTATVTVGSNWYWNDGLGNPTGSRPVEWSIAKADWLVDAPVIAPFTFDGNAHELVQTGTVSGPGVVGAAMEYALVDISDGADPEAHEELSWASTVPTASEAGSYKIWWRVPADGNHHATGENALDVVQVAKAETRILLEMPETFEYTGEPVSDPVVSTNRTGESGTETLEWFEKIGGLSGRLSLLADSGSDDTGWKLLDAAPAHAGVYKVRVSVAVSENYMAASAEKEFTITQAAVIPVVKPLEIDGWRVGETPVTPVFESRFGQPVFEYSPVGSESWSTDVPVNVGQWRVRARVDESADWVGYVSEPVNFAIEEAVAPSPAPDAGGDAGGGAGVVPVPAGAGAATGGVAGGEAEPLAATGGQLVQQAGSFAVLLALLGVCGLVCALLPAARRRVR